ncbi:MAG: hypothetical protein ABH863_05535 [Candidatus Micrarchaeota archaeon]
MDLKKKYTLVVFMFFCLCGLGYLSLPGNLFGAITGYLGINKALGLEGLGYWIVDVSAYLTLGLFAAIGILILSAVRPEMLKFSAVTGLIISLFGNMGRTMACFFTAIITGGLSIATPFSRLVNWKLANQPGYLSGQIFVAIVYFFIAFLFIAWGFGLFEKKKPAGYRTY